MIGLHPHESWQLSTFGCSHISQGRQLRGQQRQGRFRLADLTGPVPREQQDARMRSFDATLAQDYEGPHQPFDPAGNVVRGASGYGRLYGLGDPHAHSYDHVRTTADATRRIGHAYGMLPEHDPESLHHFGAMRDEVGRQFDHLTGPMGIHVESVDHDPYPTVHHMVHDLRTNNRIKVLGTRVTGSHPYFSDDQNDMFRAVHDAFGHAATGRGFDASGEEAAYLAHSRMFTPHARPALQAETRGQNAFVHLNGDFGPQKIAVLPHHIQNIPVIGASSAERTAALDTPLSNPEDVGRYEEGRQRVNMVGTGEWDSYPLCDFHTKTMLDKASRPQDVNIEGGYEGRCSTCERSQHVDAVNPPWDPRRPGQRAPADSRMPNRPKPVTRRNVNGDPGRWPHRELRPGESIAPFKPGGIQSMNSVRYAVRLKQNPLQKKASGLQRLAYQISADMPDMVRLAHDSGDPQNVFHCPFCGSGQVIARSDGSIECEFCSACFTVQVQPTYPAFPQTVNGEPMDVPGMGPDWSPYGGPAPGEAPPAGEEGMDGGEEGAPPFGGGEDDAAPPEEDGGDSEDEGSGPPPGIKKKTYRTVTGAVLDAEAYLKHLALSHTRDAKTTLSRVRRRNGAA